MTGEREREREREEVTVVRKRAEAGEKCGERDGRVKSCSSTSTYNIGGNVRSML